MNPIYGAGSLINKSFIKLGAGGLSHTKSKPALVSLIACGVIIFSASRIAQYLLFIQWSQPPTHLIASEIAWLGYLELSGLALIVLGGALASLQFWRAISRHLHSSTT